MNYNYDPFQLFSQGTERNGTPTLPQLPQPLIRGYPIKLVPFYMYLRASLTFVAAPPTLSCGPALYLEKLGDDHLEDALGEMDYALQRMFRCGIRSLYLSRL